MRWRIIIPAMVLVLASCSAQTSVSTVPKEYENEYSEVKAQILQISIPDEKEYSEQLNQAFLQEADEAIAGFDTEAGEASSVERHGAKSVFQTTQNVSYNKNNFISVTEEAYVYTGGAHGMTVRKTRNIDTLAKKEITLSDLFSEEGYKETLNRMINEVKEKHPEEYSELWEQPQIKPEQDFYLTDTDLVVYYQPYELSYYARGFVEVPLRLTELKGYLKEEYYRLIEE